MTYILYVTSNRCDSHSERMDFSSETEAHEYFMDRFGGYDEVTEKPYYSATSYDGEGGYWTYEFKQLI